MKMTVVGWGVPVVLLLCMIGFYTMGKWGVDAILRKRRKKDASRT